MLSRGRSAQLSVESRYFGQWLRSGLVGMESEEIDQKGLGLWRGSAGRGLPVPSTAVLGADVSWSSSLSRVLCLLGVSRRRLAGPLARDPRGRKCRKCRKCTGGRDLRNVQCSNGQESRWKGFQPRIDRQGVSRASPSDDPWRLQDWAHSVSPASGWPPLEHSTGDETFHVNHGQTRTSHSFLRLSMSAQFVRWSPSHICDDASSKAN